MKFARKAKSTSTTSKLLVSILAALALSLTLAACGDDDDGASTATPTAASTDATTLNVELKDFEIITDPASGPPGDFDFQITNSGPSVHEFVVAKTDLAAANLPTLNDGSVDEESSQLEAVDEAEDVAANGTARFTASLESGHYVFFCNIVEGEGTAAIVHYTDGMRGDFTVE